MKMHIGIDFDNTIVTYDRVFYKYALKLGLISQQVGKNKQTICEIIRSTPGGEDRWIELQALVYGRKMAQAHLAKGVGRFFRTCHKRSIKVSIISHKTLYPNVGPRINLHTESMKWMESRGFFSESGFGLSADNVFFERTRAAKLERILKQGCTHFIDDLEEVFLEPGFPLNVERLLYAPGKKGASYPGVRDFGSWDEIHDYFFPNSRISEVYYIIEEVIGHKLGEQIVSIEPLPRGANSLVFKVTTHSRKKFLVKKYFVYKDDPRDRLGTEFKALTFLWENGIRVISEPICADSELNVGVYGFVKGRTVDQAEIGLNDVMAASAFLGQLRSLAKVTGADSQPIASEACLNLRAYIECIEHRLKNLEGLSVTGDNHKALRIYLIEEFVPVFEQIKDFVLSTARSEGLDVDRMLSRADRTLSPSDVGFHNVLRRDDGDLLFFDFEYFGWDDPAKMIADFLSQHEIPVPFEYREAFFREIQGHCEGDSKLEKRFSLIFPLVELKWCLIILNEFLPIAEERRRISEESTSLKIVRARQLEKSKKNLVSIKEELASGTFPLLKWRMI